VSETTAPLQLVNILRVVHRWLGLTLAVVVLAVATSGGLLLLRDPYYRVAYPEVRTPITAAETAARADILALIEARWRAEGIQLVKFPGPGVNAYRVWLRDGTEAFVHPRTGGVIDRWHWSERLPTFLFELHAHLFADRPGTIVNGMAALAVLFMALTGIVFWWPARRAAFRLRGAIPRRAATADLLRSHAAVGAIAFVPVVVFVATGAVMAFYQPTASFASRVLDGRPPAQPNARVLPQDRASLPWPVILSSLDSTYPDSDTVYYYPGTPENARLMFRKRFPGEWHPNGRSYIVIDPYTARVVQTIDARAQGAGTRLMNTVYPVHAAAVGGPVVVASGALATVALAWLAAGGVWTYIGRRTAARRERQARAARAA
jgi:uncharacterized iron-regulated membrane protein